MPDAVPVITGAFSEPVTVTDRFVDGLTVRRCRGDGKRLTNSLNSSQYLSGGVIEIVGPRARGRYREGAVSAGSVGLRGERGCICSVCI